MTREDLKFRYYRGEKEHPLKDVPGIPEWKRSLWTVEKYAFEYGATKLINEYKEFQKLPYAEIETWTKYKELRNDKHPDGEKAVCLYCLFASVYQLGIEGYFTGGDPIYLPSLPE